MNKVLFREFTETSSNVFPLELDLLARHDMYFENRAADTPELIELAHALRYQVYVTERKFEDADQHIGGLEMDEFDDHSAHGLLFHRPTGDAIGTVRLIQPVKGKEDGNLPIGGLLKENNLDLRDYVDVQKTVEISRFAISKSFRRRVGDDSGEAGARLSKQERISRGNLPCLSLIQFLLRQSAENGVKFWTAVMEEKLLRMLAGMGIHFTSVGPMVSHHGLRQPSYLYVPEMLERCKAEQREYWNVLTNHGELADKVNYTTGNRKALAC